MATTNLPKWLQVIDALNKQPDKIVWHADCVDCQTSHTNFALWDVGGPVATIAWHDCTDLDTCCDCHVQDHGKAVSYFGSELHDSEEAENRAYAWYATHCATEGA